MTGKAAAAVTTFGVNFLLRKIALFTPRETEAVE
jgi:hypothetical protein